MFIVCYMPDMSRGVISSGSHYNLSRERCFYYFNDYYPHLRDAETAAQRISELRE